LEQVGGNVVIEFASLGNDAGMLGAAMLARSTAAAEISHESILKPI